RVVVIEHADVGAPIVVDRVLPAAVDIPLQAAAVIADTRIVQPADVRCPGADVDAVGVCVVESALGGGLAIGLRQSAENIWRNFAYIAFLLGLNGEPTFLGQSARAMPYHYWL